MNNNNHKSKFVRSRALLAAGLCSGAALLALAAFGAFTGSSAQAKGPAAPTKPTVEWGRSVHNDVSPTLRSMVPFPAVTAEGPEREANLNPLTPFPHVDVPDPIIQNGRISARALLSPAIPAFILSFDGIPFPGVGCSCSPPDTNGAVGATQYVQMVNEGFQVFNKVSGVSVLGPNSISSVWAGFGGVCETSGDGDPVVLYDHFANRWIISQFAGASVPTDECIAVSTSSDATGTWNRYDFNLGSNFFDYPHIGIWRDAYYCAFNVFNSAGSSLLGRQAFAFDRNAMIAGTAATFVAAPLQSPSVGYFLPADIDGPTLPPVGAPETLVGFPTGGNYPVYHFHVDFVTPVNSTFTTFASPAAAAFTTLCSGTRACVPDPAGGTVDGIGDRFMHRLAYRNFGDHEAVVANYSVSAGGVSAIRWLELRNVTAGPVTLFQESTYAPGDGTWRWMGSVAMDSSGDIALGFSAMSATTNPQVRYTGRLVTDPINTLPQGEGTFVSGTGSPTGSANRWGDYSSMTVDPVDDATFWYTQEYFTVAGTQFNWRTRIGNFKFGPVIPANSMASGGSSVVAAGPNGVLDPSESVTVSLGLKNVGGPGNICTTAGLTGTLQPGGGVTAPSGPQVYGVTCAPNGPAVFKNFTFTVDPALACGGTVTATLAVTDGATNYGNVTYTFPTGNLVTTFTQNFDAVVAPALPAGWTAPPPTGIESAWVTSTSTPNSAPNEAFAPDPSNLGDTQLISPAFPVPAGGARLSFKNNYNTESTYDGMVLEISINGGAFNDIITAGGTFVTGAYVGPISTSFGSSIAGRQAWNGNSGGYINSVVNLPPAANGQMVQLKWRMASDNSVAVVGVMIDDISVSAAACGGNAPTASSIVSRHLQPATPFDINMPLGSTSTCGVECRRGTGGSSNNHQLVLTFGSPVTFGGASVTSVDGLATATPSVAGNVVTINLAAVADAQVLGVTLSAVNDGMGNLGNINIPMGVLLGDTNGDRSVNAADVGQTKSQSGNTVSGSNFREDPTLDGSVNASDVGLVKSRSGNGLP